MASLFIARLELGFRSAQRKIPVFFLPHLILSTHRKTIPFILTTQEVRNIQVKVLQVDSQEMPS